MNLSRAYSLAYGDQLSVGRVQTPTLAMLVERELVIRSFVAEDYLEVVASFRPAGHKSGNTYSGHMVPHAARGGGGQGIAAKGHAAVCRWRRRKPDYRARAGEGGEEPQEGQVLPPDLVKGQPQDVVNIEALKKKTRPPKRFTEATLLTAMETSGKTLDEKELSDAMRETGLGTPATRAAIIEVLLKRAYIVRNGKSLEGR
jgi:DNA topoisomerase IA